MVNEKTNESPPNELPPDLQAKYFDLLLKFNVFFYAVTGALLSFFLSQIENPLMEYCLFLPILMGSWFGILFICLSISSVICDFHYFYVKLLGLLKNYKVRQKKLQGSHKKLQTEILNDGFLVRTSFKYSLLFSGLLLIFIAIVCWNVYDHVSEIRKWVVCNNQVKSNYAEITKLLLKKQNIVYPR